MPIIPILLSDTQQQAAYKISLVGQVSGIESEIAALILRRRYYEGDHDLLLNDDQKAFLDNIVSKEGRHPIDNKIAVVINKLRRRVNVQGFAMPDEQASEAVMSQTVPSNPKTATEWVWKWWIENKMDAGERDLYEAALIDSYAFVSVEHNGTRPVFHVQKRWAGDGTSGIRFFWEQDTIKRNPAYAVKYWYTRDPLNLAANNLLRVTLYTKDRIYKWIRLTNPREQGKYFEYLGEREEDDTNLYQIRDSAEESYPIYWTENGREGGEPLGLAVIPFVAPMGNLIDSVIGLQDALNKTWLDILATADQQGFGVYWAGWQDNNMGTGLSRTSGGGGNLTTDDDGYGIRPGSVVDMPNKATLNKLPADDIMGLHNTVKLIVTAIASNTEQPLFHFVPLSGEVPSGAALDTLSKPVAEQAGEITVSFTPAWSEVMTLAQKVDKVFGGSYKGAAVTLTPKWKPQPKSPDSEANAFLPQKTLVDAIAVLTGLGVSVEGAARFLGVSEDRLKLLADSGMLPPPEQ